MNSARLIGFEELPQEILGRLDGITELWKRQLEERLVGLIITAPSCCVPFGRKGVIWRPWCAIRCAEEKLARAREIIVLDGKNCPIEISAVTLHNAQNWKNPGSCVFHYSEF